MTDHGTGQGRKRAGGPRLFWISPPDRLSGDPPDRLFPGTALSRHLLGSLRAGVGESFRFVLPGPPVRIFMGTVETRDPLVLELRSLPPDPADIPPVPFDLGVALLKGLAWEDLIEPLVCLGVRTLVPVVADRSQLRWSREQFLKKSLRFETKIREASQLSGRTDRMEISPPVPLAALLGQGESLVLLLDPDPEAKDLSSVLETLRPGREILALIGPEGGWSPGERALLDSLREAGRGIRAGLGPLVFPGRLAPIVAGALISHALHRFSRERTAL